MDLGLSTIEKHSLRLVEQAVKERDKSRVTVLDVLSRSEQSGLSPAFCLLAIQRLGDQNLVPLPLFEHHGNLDDSAPMSHYAFVEVGLTRIGEAVASGDNLFPIGMINGNCVFGGSVPPFNPEAVREALRHYQLKRVKNYPQLTKTIGGLGFPTPHRVEGRLQRLLSGKPTPFTLASAYELEGRTFIIKGTVAGVDLTELGEMMATATSVEWIELQADGQLVLRAGSDEAVQWIKRKLDEVEPFAEQRTLSLGEPWYQAAERWLECIGDRSVDSVFGDLS